MEGPAAREVTDTRPSYRQLITLIVGNVRGPDERAAICWALARLDGVEMVGLDVEMFRVWVFGDGTVDPRELVGELAACGFGSRVLQCQLGLPA